ncbi:hypothetical protein M5689_002179 [Euphorbia peplus]|nr:hypothetical protein M5689_002179 [Euphorbia peplus]
MGEVNKNGVLILLVIILAICFADAAEKKEMGFSHRMLLQKGPVPPSGPNNVPRIRYSEFVQQKPPRPPVSKGSDPIIYPLTPPPPPRG